MCHSGNYQIQYNRRVAFTLIELLTVIAVVAILAAILIPAVSGVRERANSASSVSNLRQIWNGLSTYSLQNGGSLPAIMVNGVSWHSSIRSELGIDDNSTTPEGTVLQAPGMPTPAESPSRRLDWSTAHYGVNGEVFHNYANRDEKGNPQGFTDGLRVIRVGDPAKVMLAADSYNSRSLHWWHNPSGSEFEVRGGIEFRYGGKANAVFIDGSVRSLEPDDVATDASSSTKPIWLDL